ncbi:Hypothetical protein UVM_LOCUS401 [uncultured virus]|nr:Hypothetical protein UVM_LOCUS401 [uncultured virus]
MSPDSHNALGQACAKWTGILYRAMIPVVHDYLLMLYSDAEELVRKRPRATVDLETVGGIFQRFCREVNDWSVHEIAAKVQSLTAQCAEFASLICTVIKANLGVMATLRSETSHSLQLTYPRCSVFVHACFCAAAESAFRYPILFAKSVPAAQRAENHMTAELLIQNAIESVVLSYLPLSELHARPRSATETLTESRLDRHSGGKAGAAGGHHRRRHHRSRSKSRERSRAKRRSSSSSDDAVAPVATHTTGRREQLQDEDDDEVRPSDSASRVGSAAPVRFKPRQEEQQQQEVEEEVAPTNQHRHSSSLLQMAVAGTATAAAQAGKAGKPRSVVGTSEDDSMRQTSRASKPRSVVAYDDPIEQADRSSKPRSVVGTHSVAHQDAPHAGTAPSGRQAPQARQSEESLAPKSNLTRWQATGQDEDRFTEKAAPPSSRHGDSQQDTFATARAAPPRRVRPDDDEDRDTRADHRGREPENRSDRTHAEPPQVDCRVREVDRTHGSDGTSSGSARSFDGGRRYQRRSDESSGTVQPPRHQENDDDDDARFTDRRRIEDSLPAAGEHTSAAGHRKREDGGRSLNAPTRPREELLLARALGGSASSFGPPRVTDLALRSRERERSDDDFDGAPPPLRTSSLARPPPSSIPSARTEPQLARASGLADNTADAVTKARKNDAQNDVQSDADSNSENDNSVYGNGEDSKTGGEVYDDDALSRPAPVSPIGAAPTTHTATLRPETLLS